jgi:hypothetical protein
MVTQTSNRRHPWEWMLIAVVATWLLSLLIYRLPFTEPVAVA